MLRCLNIVNWLLNVILILIVIFATWQLIEIIFLNNVGPSNIDTWIMNHLAQINK